MRSKGNSSFGLLDLLRLVAPRRKLFALGLLALIGGSGLTLILPEIVRRLVNAEGTSLLLNDPWQVTAILVGLFAVQGILFYLRSNIFGIVGHRTVFDLRKSLYYSLLHQPMAFYDSKPVGDQVSRLSADCAALQEAVSIKLSVFLRYGLQVLVGILLMAWLSPRLTLALMLAMPIIVFFGIALGKRLKGLSKSLQAELGRSGSIAEETLSSMRLVRSFGQTRREALRYEESLSQLLGFGEARSRFAAFFATFVNFLMNAAIVAVLIYGVSLVHQHQLSVGDLTAFLLYGAIVAVSFALISGTYAELVQAYAAGERIHEIINQPTEHIGGSEQVNPSWCGAVNFIDVEFSYPSRPDSKVLNKLSFSVLEGQVTAIVGPSGAGKSTVAQLILGLYMPTAGELRIGANLINNLDLDAYRRSIAIVPQEPVMFSVSIEENLRYGKPEASRDEIIEACKKSRIWDFISKLPQELSTQVGPRGVQLSGGQKQRLAIARAMLRNPKLLILDEATSALDSENEALVQEAITELMRGRTSLVIAHRLATVRHANQIIVLDGGRLVEHGSHAELSRSGGVYQQMVSHQDLT